MGFAAGFAQGFGQSVLDKFHHDRERHERRVDNLSATAIERALEKQSARDEERTKAKAVAGKLSTLFGGGEMGQRKAYMVLKEYGSADGAQAFFDKASAVLELDPNANVDDLAQFTFDEGMTSMAPDELLNAAVPEYVYSSKLPKIKADGLYGLLYDDKDMNESVRKDLQTLGIATEKGETIGLGGKVRISAGKLAHPKEMAEMRMMALKENLTEHQIEKLTVDTQTARQTLKEMTMTQQARVSEIRQALRLRTAQAEEAELQVRLANKYSEEEIKTAIALQKAQVMQSNRPEDREEFYFKMKDQYVMAKRARIELEAKGAKGSVEHEAALREENFYSEQVTSAVTAATAADSLSKMSPARAYNSFLTTAMADLGIKYDVTQTDLDTSIVRALEGNVEEIQEAHDRAREAFRAGYGSNQNAMNFLKGLDDLHGRPRTGDDRPTRAPKSNVGLPKTKGNELGREREINIPLIEPSTDRATMLNKVKEGDTIRTPDGRLFKFNGWDEGEPRPDLTPLK